MQTLDSNLDGYENTVVGDGAMYYNTGGFMNTAIGYRANMNNRT